jgi:hypothetical protein
MEAIYYCEALGCASCTALQHGRLHPSVNIDLIRLAVLRAVVVQSAQLVPLKSVALEFKRAVRCYIRLDSARIESLVPRCLSIAVAYRPVHRHYHNNKLRPLRAPPQYRCNPPPCWHPLHEHSPIPLHTVLYIELTISGGYMFELVAQSV